MQNSPGTWQERPGPFAGGVFRHCAQNENQNFGMKYSFVRNHLRFAPYQLYDLTRKSEMGKQFKAILTQPLPDGESGRQRLDDALMRITQSPTLLLTQQVVDLSVKPHPRISPRGACRIRGSTGYKIIAIAGSAPDCRETDRQNAINMIKIPT